MPELNEAQQSVLSLLNQIETKEELAELEELLIQYLAHKTISLADKAAASSGYTAEIIQSWKKDHHRRKS